MNEERFFSGEGKRERSIKQERKIAKLGKGRETIGSGSVFRNADVEIKNLKIRVEAKYTDKNQFILNKKILDKLKAQSRNEIPVLNIQIKEENWYLIRPSEWFLILEYLENLKQGG
jgi:hypothetical protein